MANRVYGHGLHGDDDHHHGDGDYRHGDGDGCHGDLHQDPMKLAEVYDGAFGNRGVWTDGNLVRYGTLKGAGGGFCRPPGWGSIGSKG